MTSSVLPSTLFYDQRESLVQFRTFKPIFVRLEQKIVMTDSQNKEEHVEDDEEGWIVMIRQKGKQPNSIQMKSHFYQKHGKGSNFNKRKEKRNKKIWKLLGQILTCLKIAYSQFV